MVTHEQGAQQVVGQIEAVLGARFLAVAPLGMV